MQSAVRSEQFDTLSPSIIPGFDADVYLVLDDFGQLGRAYSEVDEDKADRETLIRSLVDGQYRNPVRMVAPSILPKAGRVM